MTRNPLRDSLAHSLTDELYPPRQPIEPIIGGWREVREIVGGFVLLILIGVAFWLWMSIDAASKLPVPA
jgi:hypothetical protein